MKLFCAVFVQTFLFVGVKFDRRNFNNLSVSFIQDVLEMQADAIEKGQKVIILDDLLATGGESWQCI